MKKFALGATVLLTLTAAFAQAPKQEPIQQIAQSVGIIGGVWFALGVYLIVAAWVSLISALLPDWVQRKAEALQAQGARPFLFGLVVAFVLLLVSVVLFSVSQAAPPAGALGVLFLLALFTAWAVGWVPVTWVVGRRVAALLGMERTDLTIAWLGALVLHFATLFPIVGWAVALYWAIAAVGLWIIRS